MASERAQRLIRIRTSLERIVEIQTASWEESGCPPTMSIDGESYQWDSWLTSKMAEIERLSGMIQRASPYIIRSRSRG